MVRLDHQSSVSAISHMPGNSRTFGSQKVSKTVEALTSVGIVILQNVEPLLGKRE